MNPGKKTNQTSRNQTESIGTEYITEQDSSEYTIIVSGIDMTDLEKENEKLKEEIKKLRQKLQFAYTKISDLRYTKKQMIKALRELDENFRI